MISFTLLLFAVGLIEIYSKLYEDSYNSRVIIREDEHHCVLKTKSIPNAYSDEISYLYVHYKKPHSHNKCRINEAIENIKDDSVKQISHYNIIDNIPRKKLVYKELWKRNEHIESKVIFSERDYRVLSDLFYGTNGPHWLWRPNKTIWSFENNTINGNSNNPCNWQGIICKCSVTSCIVSVLSLKAYNITGKIPIALGNFTNILLLNLGENSLHGTIPYELGQLTSLSELSLNGNNLTGSIPPQLGNLTLLSDLTLSYNQLIGTIPDELSHLKHLNQIDLFFNNITGSIPDWLFFLPKLQIVNFANNKLSNKIPSNLPMNSILSQLILSFNSLTGPIPIEITQFNTLHYLDLTYNQFTSSIPNNIGALRLLEYFSLSSNKFTGKIPDSVGQMNFLTAIVLQFNTFQSSLPESMGNINGLNLLLADYANLSGPVPKTLKNCSRLLAIDLGFNHLTSTLPPELSSLLLLNYFSVQNNQMTGSIPSSYGNFTLVYDIFFNDNYLTGTIPPSIVASQVLFILDLSRNHFTGTIPFGFSHPKLMISLYLYDNHLTGTISPSIGNLTRLNYLELYSNYLTGSLPDTIGEMSDIYLFRTYYNYFTGTIPSSLYRCQHLVNIGFDGNYYTGQILPDIVKLKYLSAFDVSSNLLSGTLPNTINRLENLNILFLHNNRFEGSLSYIVNATTQLFLENLDVSDNEFTGVIPTDPFQMPSLLTFAAVVNCLHGSIPKSICESKALNVLALDGLATASVCRKLFFPWLKSKSSYELIDPFRGIIPRCLFNMSTLTTLHLSGNGIKDSLPTDLVLSPSLKYLSLSHNEISGSIPESIQMHPWYSLDLSYNRFYGQLSSYFPYPAPNHSVYLQVNRISGMIPPSLTKAINISILNGNIFECDLSRSNLPSHDPDVAIYQCGSFLFNTSITVWLGFCLVIIIAFIYCVAAWYYNKSQNKTNEIDEESASSEQSNEKIGLFHWSQQILLWRRSFKDEASSTSITHANLSALAQLFYDIRKTSILLMLFSLFVLLPIYQMLSLYYKTYDNQYGWSVSVGFIGGMTPAIIVACVMFLLIVALYYRCAVLAAVHKITRVNNNGSYYNESDSPELLRRKQRDIIIQYIRLSGLVLLNFVVVIAINMIYIYVSITYNVVIVNIAQFCLIAFKLFWTFVALHGLMRWMNKLSKKDVKPEGDSRNSNSHNSFEQNEKNNILGIIRTSNINNDSLNTSTHDETTMEPVVNPMIQRNTHDSDQRGSSSSEQSHDNNRNSENNKNNSDRPSFTNTINRISIWSNGPIRQSIDIPATLSQLWNVLSTSSYSVSDLEVILILCFLIVFNYVALPCLVVSGVNTECFNSLIVPSAPVTTSYEFQRCSFAIPTGEFDNSIILNSTYACTTSTTNTNQVSYTPPFIYSYQCSSYFITGYATVYIYMFLCIAFLDPLLYQFAIFLHFILAKSCEKSENDGANKNNNNRSDALYYNIKKMILKNVVYFLPDIYKPVPIKDNNNNNNNNNYNNSGRSSLFNMESRNKLKENNELLLFDKNKFIATLNGILALQVTFGVVFPPLSLVMCVAIICKLFAVEVSIGRMLILANKSNQFESYLVMIEQQTSSVTEYMWNSLWVIFPVSICFYLLFLFDIMGGSTGWINGLILVLTFSGGFVIVCFYISFYTKKISLSEAFKRSSSRSWNRKTPLASPMRLVLEMNIFKNLKK
eukprot:gene5272-7324_t